MPSSPRRGIALLSTLLAGLVLGSLAGGARAAEAAGNSCQIKKLRAAGKEARQRLLCEKRGLASGADPICIGDAQERRALAFQRAEASGGCITHDDSAEIGDEVSALGLATPEALRPGGPAVSRCTTGEIGAMARAVGKLAAAHARDARRTDPTRLAAALAAAQASFDVAFTRATQRGDCLSGTSSAAAYEIVTNAVARLRGKLFPVCGDDVKAPTEICDGNDATTCPGTCTPSCTCLTEACPCWTAAEINATFPEGVFDQNGLGGATCTFSPPQFSLGSVASCTLPQPGGQPPVTLPRLGVAVVGDVCARIFVDLDLDQNGECNGAPDFTLGLSPEEIQLCAIAIATSEPVARECN